MNKPAIPSWDLMREPEKYIPSRAHSDPKQFRERLRTADMHMRDSDGQDGDTTTEERDE